MALARLKNWVAEILTFSDINAEFNNILNNALAAISPLTGNLAAGGFKITGLAAGTVAGDSVRFEDVPGVATQANQETGTSLVTFVSPGRQQYHPSAVKFWVFATNAGTPTIVSSYNVTSITDGGVGDNTVNLTTAFSAANQAPVHGNMGNIVTQLLSLGAGTSRVLTRNLGTNALEDNPFAVAGMGDQ